jgi:hypothetical protein
MLFRQLTFVTFLGNVVAFCCESLSNLLFMSGLSVCYEFFVHLDFPEIPFTYVAYTESSGSFLELGRLLALKLITDSMTLLI